MLIKRVRLRFACVLIYDVIFSNLSQISMKNFSLFFFLFPFTGYKLSNCDGWGLGLGAWGLGLGKVSTVLTLKRPDEGLTLETLAFKL